MSPDEVVAAVAARQHGMVTRRQLREAALSDRQIRWRVERGRLVRLEPRVFRIAGAPVTWRQRVLAACWAEDGWAAQRCGAAVWRLEGCPEARIEVLTPRWRRRVNASIRVHETRAFDAAVDAAEHEGIPVTSPARTIVDLAAQVPAQRVEVALDDALRRRLLVPEDLWQMVERLDVPGRPWVKVARRLCATRLGTDHVRPNVFEKRLFELLAGAGLPLPEPQVQIRTPDGRLLGRVDWLFPVTKVVLQCDSFEWHGQWVRRKADLRLDRQLTALGYRVLRVSWEDLTECAPQLVRDVAGALTAASA